jgi:hypothetical protein
VTKLDRLARSVAHLVEIATRTPRITDEVATAEARAGAPGVPQNPESDGFGRRPGDCAGSSDPVAMRSGLVPRARRSG